MPGKTGTKLQKAMPYLLIGLALLGFVASFALTYDKIQVLKNPHYIPDCNINPIISCGSVMKTQQANLFGVPNTIYGIIGFSALITVGVLMLAGGKFKRWFWQLMQLGVSAGLIFVIYLFYQGIYRIDAVCPWCFVTWLTVSALFLYVTVYNLGERIVVLPKRCDQAVAFVQKHSGDILVVWFLIIISLILNHFWYYWKTLI